MEKDIFWLDVAVNYVVFVQVVKPLDAIPENSLKLLFVDEVLIGLIDLAVADLRLQRILVFVLVPLYQLPLLAKVQHQINLVIVWVFDDFVQLDQVGVVDFLHHSNFPLHGVKSSLVYHFPVFLYQFLELFEPAFLKNFYRKVLVVLIYSLLRQLHFAKRASPELVHYHIIIYHFVPCIIL